MLLVDHRQRSRTRQGRDYLYVFSLLVLITLVVLNWNDYEGCDGVHFNLWLVVHFSAFVVFHVFHWAFERSMTERSLCPHLAKYVALFNLWIVYPFLWGWTIYGSYLYWKASSCMDTPWLVMIWIVYSYMYLSLFLAMMIVISRAIQQRRPDMANAEAIQDFINRWHQQVAYGMPPATVGLSPEQIDNLPMRRIGAEVHIQTCSICLNDVVPGTVVRDLHCKHVFHVGCIDQWLAIKDSCPNCVRRVETDTDRLLDPQV